MNDAVLRQLTGKNLEWTSKLEDPGTGVQREAGMLLQRAAWDVGSTFLKERVRVGDFERASTLGLMALRALMSVRLQWNALVVVPGQNSPMFAGRAFVRAVLRRREVVWQSPDGCVIGKRRGAHAANRIETLRVVSVADKAAV